MSDKSFEHSLLPPEVTEPKRIEDALRESEEQCRLLFQSNPHAMWVYDLETLRFLAVNDAAVEQYGYSREEFLSMTLGSLIRHYSMVCDYSSSMMKSISESLLRRC